MGLCLVYNKVCMLVFTLFLLDGNWMHAKRQTIADGQIAKVSCMAQTEFLTKKKKKEEEERKCIDTDVVNTSDHVPV